MRTTFLLTHSQQLYTGRIAGIYNFIEGRMVVDGNDETLQLIERQVCRYHGAVREGTEEYRKAVAGGFVNQKWAPGPGKPAEAPVVHRDPAPARPSIPVVQPDADAGSGHAQAGADPQAVPPVGSSPEQPDLPQSPQFSDAALKTAVMDLDPDLGDNWTSAGKPKLDVLEPALGSRPTRVQVESVAPGHTRDMARALKQITG